MYQDTYASRAEPIPLEKGAFCVSIDVEMLWGVWDYVQPHHERHCADLERPVVKRLLEILGRHHLGATWAVVGRLMDDSPGYDGLRGRRSNWFAPELVDFIRTDTRANHEVATHSYGHIYFGDVPRAEAGEDLQRARDLHARLNLRFESLVFPRDEVGHLDALIPVGLKVFRSGEGGIIKLARERAPRLEPLANLLDKVLPVAPPVVCPLRHPNGLVELPSSLLLIGRNGLRRIARPAILRRKLRLGLQRAIQEKRLFHLWFHPSNFYYDADVQYDLLETVVAEAAAFRDEGILDVMTMADFGGARVSPQSAMKSDVARV